MTMMYNDEREHPDEGTIHAWLDGALGDDESAHLEAHVATCPKCEAAVADARGLIAGASRVLTELDEIPQPTVRPFMKSDAPTASLWRSLRITPARASIAALLIVAVGVVFTSRQPGVTNVAVRDTSMLSSPAAEKTSAKPDAAPPQSAAEEKLALAQRMGEEQPRMIERSKEPGVVVPPAESTASAKAAMADLAASNQVAQARQTIAATRDTLAGRAADKTAVTALAAPSAVPTTVVAGASAAESRARMAPAASTLRLRSSGGAVQPGCYRVDAVNGPGSWGDAKLPFIVALDSTGGGVARVLTPSGEDTESRAIITRLDADSLQFRLRRIGFTGSLALGGMGPKRSGFAQSQKAENSPQSITVTAASVACP